MCHPAEARGCSEKCSENSEKEERLILSTLENKVTSPVLSYPLALFLTPSCIASQNAMEMLDGAEL